jgi:hypothetical protein
MRRVADDAYAPHFFCMTITLPTRDDAAPYFFTYIDQVPAGDIRRILEDQQTSTLALLRGISDTDSRFRYAPDKWSIREVVSHVSDCERMFTFRAMWFARGFDAPLPSFDQNVAIETCAAEQREWGALIDEFAHVRAATNALFRDLPEDAWPRRGVAGGNPFTVNALAYITAGHTAHHVRILREQYGVKG